MIKMVQLKCPVNGYLYKNNFFQQILLFREVVITQCKRDQVHAVAQIIVHKKPSITWLLARPMVKLHMVRHAPDHSSYTMCSSEHINKGKTP